MLRYARNLQTCQCAMLLYYFAHSLAPALFFLFYFIYCLFVCWKGRFFFFSSFFKVSVYLFLK